MGSNQYSLVFWRATGVKKTELLPLENLGLYVLKVTDFLTARGGWVELSLVEAQGIDQLVIMKAKNVQSWFRAAEEGESL